MLNLLRDVAPESAKWVEDLRGRPDVESYAAAVRARYAKGS